MFTNWLDTQHLLDEFKTETQTQKSFTNLISIKEVHELEDYLNTFLGILEIEDPYDMELNTVFNAYQKTFPQEFS